MNTHSVPVVFLALLVSSAALAFPADQYWHMPAAGDVPNGTTYDPLGIIGTNRAGAGGIYGSGGARDFGIKCGSCHVEGTTPFGLIDAGFAVTPAWQNLAGDDAYSPGQRYTITVTLENEHRINKVYADSNAMVVAIEDANGNTSGIYITDSGQRSDTCSLLEPAVDGATATTFVYGDCHAVLAIQDGNARQRTAWTFDWQAPSAGAGDLTLFYSLVDGDASGDSSLLDDVAEGTIVLREGK